MQQPIMTDRQEQYPKRSPTSGMYSRAIFWCVRRTLRARAGRDHRWDIFIHGGDQTRGHNRLACRLPWRDAGATIWLHFTMKKTRWGGPPCPPARVVQGRPPHRTPAIFHLSLCLEGNDRWYKTAPKIPGAPGVAPVLHNLMVVFPLVLKFTPGSAHGRQTLA